MSENVAKITATKKEKDPKRVEAGKRLAAISKEAKERKMREKIEKDGSWNINHTYLLGAFLGASAISILFYARMDDREEVKEDLKPEHEQKHVVIQNDKSNDKHSCLDCL